MSEPTEIPSGPQPATAGEGAQETAQEMAQRYGTDRPRRRGLVVTLTAILAVALVGWVVWAAWLRPEPAISATLSHFDVVGTHEVRVKVVAQFRDAEAGGSCLVRATAEDHTIVGERNLTADQLRDARGSWIPIRTERRATTAELVRCTD